MNTKLSAVLTITITILISTVSGDNPKIIIVGAGAAGIATATHLLQNNFSNVEILEAENRIGGRIHTVHFGEANIDLGAQWCHGEKNNVVYENVKDLNLLESSLIPDKFYHSSRKHFSKENTNELRAIYQNIIEDPKVSVEQNLGDYFTKSYNQTINEKYGTEREKLMAAHDALEYFHLLVLAEGAANNWFEFSAISGYEVSEGDQALNWKDKGYALFLDILTKKYPNKNESLPVFDKVSLNKEVFQIKWKLNGTGEDVQVTCSDGSVYLADHVIFTPSLGVLKEKSHVLFQPTLSEAKKSAISNIGFGAVFKAFVFYPVQWWTGSNGFDLIWDTEDLKKVKYEFSDGPDLEGRSWVTYLYSILLMKANPKVLELWFTGPLVPEIEVIPDNIFVDGVNYVMDKFLGHLYNITKPDKVIRSKWYNNPHFNGTYSFRTIASNTEKPPPVETLLTPIVNSKNVPIVQFAGEATNPKHYASVHGAVETGFREAKRLIQHYDSRK